MGSPFQNKNVWVIISLHFWDFYFSIYFHKNIDFLCLALKHGPTKIVSLETWGLFLLDQYYQQGFLGPTKIVNFETWGLFLLDQY